MSPRRRGAILAVLILLLLFAAAALVAGRGGEGRDGAEGARPKLLLLTSLPLLLGEGFSLDAQPSPLIEALNARFELMAIDASDPPSLARGRLMLAVQPRAQTADNLVALDHWVRDGGRLILFADPRLDWPSELALGDVTRPPPMFADTGLLGHWGLRLDAPERSGPRTASIAGQSVRLSSPGRLAATDAGCKIAEGGLIARCRVGRGRAIIVADADLLDWQSVPDPAANRSATLALIGELG